MNNRLLQFLQAEGISQSQFADEIGVARASISHILAGRNKPSFDMIQALSAHYPTVNLDWLINGQGEMFKSESPLTELLPAEQLTEQPTEQPTAEPVQVEPSAAEPAPVEPRKESLSDRKIVKITVFFSDGTYQELAPGI